MAITAFTTLRLASLLIPTMANALPLNFFTSDRSQRRVLRQRDAGPVQAAALRPADPVLLSCVGAAFQALGQLAEAERWHRQALAQAPDSALTLNNPGITLAALGRREEAAALFRRALDTEAEAGTFCNLGAVLHGLRQPNEAADCYGGR